MLLSGATDRLIVSGAAAAAVAKSALAPIAKEIAILFMMFSKRGILSFSGQCWSVDQSRRAWGSLPNGCPDKEFHDFNLYLK
jgi:hypothetical protein